MLAGKGCEQRRDLGIFRTDLACSVEVSQQNDDIDQTFSRASASFQRPTQNIQAVAAPCLQIALTDDRKIGALERGNASDMQEAVSEKSPDFYGRLYSQPFGDLTLTSMESDPIHLSRTKSRISAAREECCLIVVQRRGRTAAEQDGRQAVLETGDIAVFDSERPYLAELQRGFQHLVLKVPREVMRRQFGPIDAITATRVSRSRGVGKLASNFVRGLQGELESLDKSVAQRLAQTSMDLMAAPWPKFCRAAHARRQARALRI